MALPRTIRWKPAEGVGLEHFELRETRTGIVASSVVVGTFEGFDFGARYEIQLAADWTFRSLRLDRTDGKALTLDRDTAGNWLRNGVPAPEFAECIDIDISASPFTNTLPIRRARFEIGVPQLFHMAWIPLDSLETFVDGQIYTMHDDRHFRFAAEDGTFTAELTIDADGLVEDYPTLFTRV